MQKSIRVQGRIQDFKLGEGALKKIAPSGGRRENIWGILCEKSRFYAKNHIFFQFKGGGRAGCAPPPLESAPACESNCSKQTACDSVVMKFIDYKQTLTTVTVLSLLNLFRDSVF